MGDLLDVPAEIIALLYLYRYTIELFFRFFKHVLGCRHLLSDDRKGIEIQKNSFRYLVALVMMCNN